MNAYLKSGKLFLWGLVSRFYFWAFALFFDPLGIIRDWVPSYADSVKVSAPLAWFILLSLLFWCAFLTYHDVRVQSAGADFYPDMTPKQLMRYLCDDAKFGDAYRDQKSWFFAAETAIRDELKKGRRLRAEGRLPGRWGDGQFRHPADFINKEFWINGHLNWIRILNSDYHGPIDAWDSVKKEGFEDIKFCREEVEAIWPKRNFLIRALMPRHFTPFEKPNFSAPLMEQS